MIESNIIAKLDAPGIGLIIITDLDSFLVARNLFELVALRLQNGNKTKITHKKAKTKKLEKKIQQLKGEEAPKEENIPIEKKVEKAINGIREKQIMKFLWEYPDSTTQDIADELNVNKPVIYPHVSQLQKDGMIIGEYMKKEGEKGKGHKHYAITEKGRKQYEADLPDFDGDFE